MTTTTLRTDYPGLFIVHEPKRGKRSACAKFQIRRSKAQPVRTIYIGTEETYEANYPAKLEQAVKAWEEAGAANRSRGVA